MDNRFIVELDPTNDDVDSKATASSKENSIYMKVYDCNESIGITFKKNLSGLKKLERLRVVIDHIESEIKNTVKNE